MKNRFIDRRRIFTGSLALVLTLLCACLVMTSCGGGAGGGAGGASIPAEEYTTHNTGGWGGGGSSGGGSGGNSGGGTGGGSVTIQGTTSLPITSYIYNGQSYPDLTALTYAMHAANASGSFDVPFTVAGDSRTRTAHVTKTDTGYKVDLEYKATCIVFSGGSSTTTTKYYYKNGTINLSDITTPQMTGWLCSENSTTYSGNTVPGIGGDITLNAVFPGFSASADSNVLWAGGDGSESSTRIDINGISGTPVPVVTDINGTASTLLTCSTQSITTGVWRITVDISGGTTPDWFTDDTQLYVTITDSDTNNTQRVPFTLKNRYKLQTLLGSDLTEIQTFDQNTTLNNLNSIVSSINGVTAGRTVVAFRDMNLSPAVVYKLSESPSMQFSSARYSSRSILLMVLLDFEMTISGGHAANAPVPAGTESDPYILNRWGTTDERQVHPSISGNIGTITTTAPADAAGKLRIAQSIPLQPVITVDDSLDDADIPAAGLKYKITVTDDGTGAYKEFWVKIVKPPVLPDFTIRINPPENYITYMSDTTSSPRTYALADLSTPFTFTPVAAGGFPDGTTFDWTIHITGTHYTYTDYTQTLSTATGVLTVSPADLGILANKVETTSIDAGQITASCTVHNNDAAVTSKDSTGTPSVCVFKPEAIPDFAVDIQPASITYPATFDSAHSDLTDNAHLVYALSAISGRFTFNLDTGTFPTGTTFNWTITAEGQTPYTTPTTTGSVTVPLTDLNLTDANTSTSAASPTKITIACVARNNNTVLTELSGTSGDIWVYRRLPDLPEFSIDITGSSDVHDTDTSNADCTVYSLTGVSSNFTFTAEGSIPAGTSFNWSIQANGSPVGALSRTGTTCNLSPANLGLALDSIGTGTSDAKLITIQCIATNSAYAEPKTFSRTIKVYKYLVTIPTFTIEVTPPAYGYDTNNSSLSATPKVYAMTSTTDGFQFTATAATSFPEGTMLEWKFYVGDSTTPVYSPSAQLAATNPSCIASPTTWGLENSMGTNADTAKTIRIECKATNTNAAASVDGTTARIKIFRLTIPQLKVTLQAPTDFPTKTVSGTTRYLVRDSNLLDNTQQFTLTVAPLNNTEQIPTGTEFSWKFGSAAYTDAASDCTVTKTAGAMCNIGTPPDSVASYTINCKATLTGAADVTSENITVVLEPLSVTMKTGMEIEVILRNNLGAGSSTVRSFAASTTPPPSGTTTYKLSADDSNVDVLAWVDNTAIKYYAVGFTDANVKIPLAADSAAMFFACEYLTSIDVSGFDTSAVTKMASMFGGCRALTTLTGLDSFDTSHVENMSYMFSECVSLNPDVSNFVTSSVTNMGGMFSECNYCNGSIDLSHFNTSNVQNMAEMFKGYGATSISGLDHFDTSNVRNMTEMFFNCHLESIDVSHFDTSSVTNMGGMFHTCSGLMSITGLDSFNTSNVQSMNEMFFNCNLESIDVSHFDTSSVTNMCGMFAENPRLRTITGLDSFNTSNVIEMDGMFIGCGLLVEIDLSSFDTSNVTSMNQMFAVCFSLGKIYASDSFVTTHVLSSDNMFDNCTSLEGGDGTSYSESNPKDKTYARIDDGPSARGYFTRKP